jgi:hypothetical protein
MTNEQRIATEQGAARRVIRALKAEGWWVWRVNDQTFPQGAVERDYMQDVFAEGVVRVTFRRTEIDRLHSVLFVFGNGSAADTVADWTFSDGDPDGFDAVVGAVTDSFTD